jgi:hypothetical protein
MASLVRASALALTAALLGGGAPRAAAGASAADSPLYTGVAPLPAPLIYEVPCSSQYRLKSSVRRAGCTPGMAPPAARATTSIESSDAAGQEAPSPASSSPSSLLRPGSCGRYVEDGFLSRAEASGLVSILDRAFDRGALTAATGPAGPSIADLNTGYVRRPWGDGEGPAEGVEDRIGGSLTNLFKPLVDPATGAVLAPPASFTREEFDAYGAMMEAIRVRVSERVFGLPTPLFFTAPTFVTRTVGREGWVPRSPHDEYWHPHADKVNTGHYDYSGLVYLSESGVDFEGGDFAFLAAAPNREGEGRPLEDREVYALLAGEDGGPPAPLSAWEEEHVVAPTPGRLLVFTAGLENVHRVKEVTKGVRYVLSMWFSCDERREFKSFLDGKEHNAFAGADAGREL